MEIFDLFAGERVVFRADLVSERVAAHSLIHSFSLIGSEERTFESQRMAEFVKLGDEPLVSGFKRPNEREILPRAGEF